MRIQHDFDYDTTYDELSDEFCTHDSDYQAETINEIGLQFKIWSQDKKRTATYIQILEIAEQLNDNGKWFIETLCDYVEDNIESESDKSADTFEKLLNSGFYEAFRKERSDETHLSCNCVGNSRKWIFS